MSYKIIVDSCCELPDSFKQSVNYEIVPLLLEVDGHSITDDETFDQASFLKRVANSIHGPKSHCPSPELYMNSMKDPVDHVYVITLSGNLSGSYNSAEIGRNMYLEEYGQKDIYVFDSRSASCGETQIAYWIKELEEKKLSFNEIVSQVETLIDNRRTFFVLETLETLRKNGRLSNIKAFVASTLNIKPIMSGTKEGTIVQEGQARGISKALTKMVDMTLKGISNPEERTLMISHCNCKERAEKLLAEYQSRVNFKKTVILDTRGVSSMYASDGGIIVTL